MRGPAEPARDHSGPRQWTLPGADDAGVAPQRRYRPELQGLRALAAGLVVVYHVWVDRVSGGVDVFFVLTGFLLTGQLVRAAARGPIALVPLWGRTLTRLVPAAATVLLSTVVASALLLPEGRWLQTVREVVASALFLQNWRLAADAVDYAARNDTASVVQHFWSLSIQGQFFLVWPLLVALVALIARSAGAALRAHLFVASLAALVMSLSFSVALTLTDQAFAYFHSLTRVWEFALGALLALVVDRIRVARRTAVGLGWTGVLGLVACGLVLQVSSVFPGWAALWPTGCAVLVLAAGSPGSRFGADRLLGSRAARYLGDLSYALYLWHWPVLVLSLVVLGRGEIGPWAGAVVVAVSLVLAALTHHLVEKPLLRRRLSVRAGYRLAAAGTAAVLASAAAFSGIAAQRTAGLPDGPDGPAHPGALALVGAEVPEAPAAPPALTLGGDWVHLDGWDCRPVRDFAGQLCDSPAPPVPDRHLMFVGDSHIGQLVGAFTPAAEHAGWRLTTLTMGACPFSTASEVDPAFTSCVDWNAHAVDEIAAAAPDAVVTLASRDARPGRTEVTPPGFVEQWRVLDALGITVVAVRDNPRFEHSPPECLAVAGRGAPECGAPRPAVFAPVPPWESVPDLPLNVTFLDLTDTICDAEHCPAEIGNVHVYMDDNHLSATYVRTMAPLAEERLRGALGW